jgi:transposase
LRGPVVDRKNHYGSRSLRGTEVAALFYTLCETAKLVGLDPHAYLLRALYTAIAQPEAVTLPEEILTSTPAA